MAAAISGGAWLAAPPAAASSNANNRSHCVTQFDGSRVIGVWPPAISALLNVALQNPKTWAPRWWAFQLVYLKRTMLWPNLAQAVVNSSGSRKARPGWAILSASVWITARP